MSVPARALVPLVSVQSAASIGQCAVPLADEGPVVRVGVAGQVAAQLDPGDSGVIRQGGGVEAKQTPSTPG